MTSNSWFLLKLMSRGFILTNTFDSVKKSTILLFTSPISSVYVNSVTFPYSVGMTQNFILRLLMPKYGGWQSRNFKIPLRYCISKAGVFSSFFTFSGAFSQIGLTCLIFAFWGLRCHQFMEMRSRLAKNHVLPIKICTNDLNIVWNYGKISILLYCI